MEQLHSILSHSGRGNLLTTLCKFLGSKIVKEFRDFIQQKHPKMILIPNAFVLIIKFFKPIFLVLPDKADC